MDKEIVSGTYSLRELTEIEKNKGEVLGCSHRQVRDMVYYMNLNDFNRVVRTKKGNFEYFKIDSIKRRS